MTSSSSSSSSSSSFSNMSTPIIDVDETEHTSSSSFSSPKRLACSDVDDAAKRVKHEYDFKTSVDPGTLRHFLSIVGSIITGNITMASYKSSTFEGLALSDIDGGNSAMAVARLAGTVEQMNGKKQLFTVPFSMLNDFIKRQSTRSTAWFKKKNGADKMIVEARDPLNQTRVRIVEFPLHENGSLLNFPPIKSTYTFHFCMADFRNTVHLAKDFNIKNIVFSVFEIKAGIVHPEIGSDQRYVKFVITGDGHTSGTGKIEEFYVSVTKEELTPDGMLIIQASEGIQQAGLTNVPDVREDQLEEKMCESFSVDFLMGFLKNMDRNSLTLRMGKGQPLVIYYPLGQESYVNLILAPLVQSVD